MTWNDLFQPRLDFFVPTAALSLFPCLRDEFSIFNVEVMAYAIHGAISEYFANTNLIHKIDSETYGSELVRIFERSVLRETHE